MNKLAKFEFNLEFAEKCIEANKHNHVTTTYYLLLKKELETGGASHYDINSPSFDNNCIQPKVSFTKSSFMSI